MTLFSDAEMRRRRAAFGAVLERGGVSHALVYGANRSGSAVSWLTGWPVTREALLVAGMDENDDVLLVAFFNHVPQARRLSRVRVEWAGSRVVATALALIAARGRLPGRIGLVGGLPFGQYRLLAEQVPDVVDLNAACTGLRLVKSAEEVAALRRGADLSDAAIAALAQALRPGATDHEALARAEHAYVAQGGLHHQRHAGRQGEVGLGDRPTRRRHHRREIAVLGPRSGPAPSLPRASRPIPRGPRKAGEPAERG